ncbi:MAG: Formate dehydrogenase subunit alpha, partial [Xanthobacteraceae bacterium]
MTTDTVTLTLDGHAVSARPGETLWELALRHDTELPHLCHRPGAGYVPDGNCRACVVEVDGERTLTASCCRQAEEGMNVSTRSPRAETARRLVMELLVADQPAPDRAHDRASSLWRFADKIGISTSRFPARHDADPHRRPDLSHPAMAVNLDACIACGLCARACRDMQANDVIGMGWRGDHHAPVFDLADPMGASTCVACGECVQACPTGALMPKSIVDAETQAGSRGADRSVTSVCPFC